MKSYEKIFARNNWMNDRLYEPDRTNFGANALSTEVLRPA